MYKIPELNDMKQYWTDEIDEVIAFIFNLSWVTGPEAVWACMQVYSMLIEGKNNGKIVRLVIGLPEDEGYDVWDLCPVEHTVTRQSVTDLKDAEIRGEIQEHWPTKVMMNKGVNDLIRIDKWVLCDEHKDEKPELNVIEGGLLGDIDLSWTDIRKE